MAETTLDINVRTSNAERSIARLERELKGLDRTSVRTEKGIRGLNNAFRSGLGFVQAYIGALSARELIRAADDFTNLEARIKDATRETGDFVKVFGDLQQAANDTGVAIASTVDVFQRLSTARKLLSATNDDIIKLTTTAQQLGVISGASTQALNAGLLQLGQGLSAGVFRAEEFNSILENIPAVARTAADNIAGMAGDVGKLRTAILAGEITSKVFFDAILAGSDDIQKRFDEIPLTVGRALTQLNNQFILFVGEVNKANGATAILIDGIKLLANNLDIAAIAVVGFFAALITSQIITFTIAMAGAVKATLAFTAALLTNPFGIVLVALGLLAGFLIKIAIDIGDVGLAFSLLGQTAATVWVEIKRGAEILFIGLKGLVNAFAAVFTGAFKFLFTTIGEGIIELARAAGSVITDELQGNINQLGQTIIQLGANLATVTDVTKQSGIELDNVNKKYDDQRKVILENVKAISEMHFATSTLNETLKVTAVTTKEIDEILSRGTFLQALSQLPSGTNLASLNKATLNAANLLEQGRITAIQYGIIIDQLRLRFDELGASATKAKEGTDFLDALRPDLAGFAQLKRDLSEVEELRISGVLTVKQATEAVILLKTAHSELNASIVEGAEELIAFGLNADQLNDIVNDATQSMADSFVEFALSGKASFADLAKSILADIAKIIIRAQLAKAITGAFGAFGGGGRAGPAGATSVNSSFSAKGNVFDNAIASGNSNVVPFQAGGIISSPTVFPMRNGTGLAGESGPEAIAPLRRDSSGNLGIGAVAPIVNINVVNMAKDVEVEVTESETGDINIQVMDIVRGGIDGGEFDSSMGASFGLSRRAF